MGADSGFAVNPGWRILLHELGVSAADVLSTAGLPPDFLDELPTRLEPDRFFAFWNAIEAHCPSQPMPLAMAKILDADIFSPPLYAAICSRNLREAARRISQYKVLTGPTEISVEDSASTMTLVWSWPLMVNPPTTLMLGEMIFWIFVARRCTRGDIDPVEVTLPDIPDHLSVYLSFLNAPIRRDSRVTLSFRKSDADRPFKSVNDAVWRAFEPGLKAELHKISDELPAVTRVRSLLLHRIAAGQVEEGAIADELALSPRTLQRRLAAEGSSFKKVLNETREELAKHYLETTNISLAELSFLLGYEDPNSFGRAFHAWTGETPAKYRASLTPRRT